MNGKEGDAANRADSSTIRKGYIGASVACAVVLAAGIVAAYQEMVLDQLCHRAIHREAVSSSLASRAAVSALECRRYEKDIFLNLSDPAVRTIYLRQWNRAWESLRGQLDQLAQLDLPGRQGKVERCRASAQSYRRHMLDIVTRIDQRLITRPEEANRALVPFKNEFRKVVLDTAVIAEECLAQADQSGKLLGEWTRWNLVSTCLMVMLPCGLILGWTVLFTRAIATRNAKLVQARYDAESASRAKSVFLANMSHELRTPMTAILGYADILLADVHEPEAREAIATIRRNGDCLLQLINDILDLSKIESGRLKVERSRCSPAAVVADVLSLMRVRATAKNLALQMECRGPIPETICTDAARLRQILINLLGNAIKFTEQGGVRLAVEMSSADRETPRIEFQVVDTGIGMTEAQQSRLFQRFTQVHGGLNEIYGGTGLGLAISKRLAEMLNGSIRVESEAGRGSTFTLAIDPGPLEGVPLMDSFCEAIAAIGQEESRPKPPPVRLDCRVLLAEDGPDNQRLIAMFLRKSHAEVTTAENGAVAVELATAAVRDGKPFDVILMDMQMPLVDGYEATRRLRGQGYRGPIVALTAHAMFDDRQKCLAAGCDDYVTKPVDRERLLEAVLKHRPARDVPDASRATRA